MVKFSKETQSIINAHKNDFNCTNYNEKIKGYGGYSSYLNLLGGVFKKYNGKTPHVRTESEFQEVAEYVFGLMTIYGFDYNNGSRYVRWQGGAPFYTGTNKGKCNWGRIDDLCKTKDKTTNCNYAMDSLFYKAGLMGGSGQIQHSSSFRGHVNTYKRKPIRNAKELKVGDLIHMFHSKITSDDPSTWKDWGHVCCVGEIENGKIITYDGGSRFMNSGSFKKTFTVDSNNKLTGSYSGYDGWVGIRVEELQSGKNIEAEAVELLHNYSKDVVNLASKYITSEGHADYIRACADAVLSGYCGSGDARVEYFGSLYNEVQDKVNWTIKTAKEVLENKYGTGDARKKALGDDYWIVQNEVNRLLK